MNDAEVAHLRARIEKLERDNRRLRSIALLPLAAVAAMGVMASSEQETTSPEVPNEVRARKFVLVDSTGDIRATLDTRNMGWPHLSRASLTLYSRDKSRKSVVSSDDLLNQVLLENNQPGTGTRSAQMQVGTEGIGLELSEYVLSTANHNMFTVGWGASEAQTIPKLEIFKSKPKASVQLVPSDPPRLHLTNSRNDQRSYSLR
jgi:hypothetical protein